MDYNEASSNGAQQIIGFNPDLIIRLADGDVGCADPK